MPNRSLLSNAPEQLVEGERLDQQAFHALYEAMPSGTKAELIDGVVYVPGPTGVEHGGAIIPLIAWLSYYAENTPGVEGLDNATTILGPKSEPQPDVLLRVRPECGGHTWNEDGYLHGRRNWSSRLPRQRVMSIWDRS